MGVANSLLGWGRLAVSWELDVKVTRRGGVGMTLHRENEVSASIGRHAMPGFLWGVLAIVDGYHLGIPLGVRKEQHCDSSIPSLISWNCAIE